MEKVCEEMATFNLPHDNRLQMMEELPEVFKLVDVKLFASYWKWYAEIAINCGKSQKDIIEIIQTVRTFPGQKFLCNFLTVFDDIPREKWPKLNR